MKQLLFGNLIILTKIRKNRQKPQYRYLEKGAVELHRAVTTKPRKIERSDFFLLDHNGQT